MHDTQSERAYKQFWFVAGKKIIILYVLKYIYIFSPANWRDGEVRLPSTELWSSFLWVLCYVDKAPSVLSTQIHRS